MSGFPIIDLLLGLMFVFFVLSIISSAVVEIIMTKMNYRSKILTQWLLTIFDKKMMQPGGETAKLGQAIANHCLTTALSKEGRATSFMDAKNFVSALFEKLTFNPENPAEKPIESLDDLLKAIDTATALDGSSLLSTELRRTILVFGTEAKLLAAPSLSRQANEGKPEDNKNSFQIFREKMENWFDTSMDRITGRLKKKHARPLTFWVGIVVVVSMNADAIQISKYLYDHKQEAKAFADKAQSVVQNLDAAKDSAAQVRISMAIDSLKGATPAGFPLGWEGDPYMKAGVGKAVRQHAAGWLATVMAIMLGAPFWFDLINKISNIRGVGSKPTSSTETEKK